MSGFASDNARQMCLGKKRRGCAMECEISAKITAVTRDSHVHSLVFGGSQNGIFRARIRGSYFARLLPRRDLFAEKLEI